MGGGGAGPGRDPGLGRALAAERDHDGRGFFGFLGLLLLIGAGVAALLSLAVIGWSLFIRWYVARKALEVDGTIAIALVAADLALSICSSFLI